MVLDLALLPIEVKALKDAVTKLPDFYAMKKLAKIYGSRTDFNKIIRENLIPKGARPDPKTYLSTEFIESHLKQFDDGATRFMKKSKYEKYGPAQADGTAFVLPKHEADKLLANNGGDKRLMEKALGFTEGTLNDDILIRIDISNPRQYNSRVPSGNEAGANNLWMPGGKLPNGNSEAVLDLDNVSRDILKITEIK